MNAELSTTSVSLLVCLKECRRHNNIYTIFITVPFQVCSITDKNNPLQSGSVFYKHAKLTCGQYKHIVIFTKNGRITLGTKLSGIQMSQIPTVHSFIFLL